MSEEKITTFEQFIEFLDKRKSSKQQANYQPTTIRTLLENGNICSKKKILEAIKASNPNLDDKKLSQIPVFDVLESQVFSIDDQDQIKLFAQDLTDEQKSELIKRCNQWQVYFNSLKELDDFQQVGLSEKHIKALKWCLKHRGRIYSKRKLQRRTENNDLAIDEFLSDDQIIHGSVKGVYKPAGDDFAQTIMLIPTSRWGLEIDRESTNLLINYDFKDPEKYKDQISWMKKCYDAKAPVGIFFRIAENKYMCLGLGKITSHNETIYKLESFGITEEESESFKTEVLDQFDTYNSDPEIDSIETINWNEFLSSLDLKQKIFEYMKIPPQTLERQPTHIREIVENLKNGIWVIPSFQRYYDWDEGDVRDFLLSIFMEYYVGSLLLWHPEENQKLKTMPVYGIEIKDPPGDLVVLDGQQRITSLNYALNPPEFNKKEKREKRFPGYYYINFGLFFNDGDPEDIILLSSEKLLDNETYRRFLFPFYKLNVTDINEWTTGLKEQFKDSDAETRLKIADVCDIIRTKLFRIYTQFEIPRVVLPESIGFDSVATIFENLNSKGKPLGTFDLLNVRLSKYGVPLRELWDDTLDDYPKIKEYYEEKPEMTKLNRYIIEAISLAFTKLKSCKRKDVLDLYITNNETVQSFEQKWKDMSQWTEKAFEFLEDRDNGFGILSQRELPYEPIIL